MNDKRSSKNREKKEQLVAEISERISRSKALVFTNYQGLTHKQLEELKKGLKESNAELVVTKNTLLKLSLAKANVKADGHEDGFNNPTAAVFAYDDVAAPLKQLAKMLKSLGLPTIKFGILDGQALSGDQVLKIAALPGREVLLAQVVGGLKSPIFGLHRALNWNFQKLVLTLNAVVQSRPADAAPAPVVEPVAQPVPSEEPATPTEPIKEEIQEEVKAEEVETEAKAADSTEPEAATDEKPNESSDAKALAGEETKSEGGEN